ncbi:glycerate kinase [Paenibacillus sp. UNC496MF]|nr:glycerate kinase [Paenibacillus sp. UNC496MF]
MKVPIADGGEGTVRAIVEAASGRYRQVEVTGPLGAPVNAQFGTIDEGGTAVIEIAAASGLTLVPSGKLNPLAATSRGTGELIRAALDIGCRKLIVGLGGSGTNDGGMGMARALGIRFLDERGEEVPDGGGGLQRLCQIDVSGLDVRIMDSEIVIACDVTNPLVGPRGASIVFGPQKGADPETVQLLDHNLAHLSHVICRELGLEVSHVPGAGAAGGLGAGMLAFLSARMASGFEVVANAAGLERWILWADVVFTGEGRTDGQTSLGKTPVGVAKLAKQRGKPIVCLSGGIGPSSDIALLYGLGIDVIAGATQSPMPLEAAIANAPDLVCHAAASIMRTMTIWSKYDIR